MIKISGKQYVEMAKKATPPSPVVKDTIFAFICGGAVCTVGEGLSSLYGEWITDADMRGALVSATLVFLGVLLTSLGVYDKLARFGGAGFLVPITGFANSVASPAIEFKSEGAVTGLAVQLFCVSGPVIVYGTAASALYGLIYWIVSLW